MNSYYRRSSYTPNGDHVEPMEQAIQNHLSVSSPDDVPYAVHKLLASTKLLQELLKLWSRDEATESEVSDLYVQIGHEFNATISAFSHYRIDMRDILDIPNELRTVLEHCLSEDPTAETLETCLPEVRRVIYKLLKGLQNRQEQWQAASRRHNGSRSSLESP